MFHAFCLSFFVVVVNLAYQQCHHRMQFNRIIKSNWTFPFFMRCLQFEKLLLICVYVSELPNSSRWHYQELKFICATRTTKWHSWERKSKRFKTFSSENRQIVERVLQKFWILTCKIHPIINWLVILWYSKSNLNAKKINSIKSKSVSCIW